MDQIKRNLDPKEIESLMVITSNSMREIVELEQRDYRNASIVDLVDIHIRLAKAYSDLPGEKYNKISLEHYEESLALVHSPRYPEALRDRKLKEIEDALQQIKSTLTTTRLALREDQKTLDLVEGEAKETYTGFWVQRKFFFLPFTEVFFVALLLLVLLLHIPLASFLHIGFYQCPAQAESIVVEGSTSLFPLLQLAKDEYKGLCGSNVEIFLNQTAKQESLQAGGVNGLNRLLQQSQTNVRASQVNIATSDAYADPTLGRELRDNQVAVAVFVLVVNNNIKVGGQTISSLQDQQLAQIYSGEASNWQDVEKDFSNQEISVVARPPSSQVRQIFEKYVLGSTEASFGPPDTLSDVDSDIASKICSTSGAIGYIPLYYYHYYQQHNRNCFSIVSIDNSNPLDPRTLSSIQIDQPKIPFLQIPIPSAFNSSACDVASSAKKTLSQSQLPYLFWTLEHMYTSNSPTDPTQKFMNFLSSSKIRQQYIQQYDKYGYLPTCYFSPDELASH